VRLQRILQQRVLKLEVRRVVMVLRGLLRLGVGVQKLQQLQLLRWEVRRLVMVGMWHS
jgi:hypothetical protein